VSKALPWIFGLLAALACLGCGGQGAPSQAFSGPGPAPTTPVILISVDTLRADRLTPFGCPRDNSPYLEKLAGESVLFTNCVSQSSSTSPSHRSIFTGQFVHRHGQDYGKFCHSPFVLAGLLHAAGYETAGFAGGGFLAPTLGFDQGFDLYTVRDDGLRPEEESGHRGLRTILPQVRNWYRQRAARPPAEASKPFFLFVHTYDVHCPYWPEQPWRTRYTAGLRTSLDFINLCGLKDFQKLFENGKELPPEEREYLQAMYDGDIAMTDSRLGDWLEELRADGTLDRSLLIFLSDHGESLGDHRCIGHTLMWEEQLRVPLLIRFPGGRFAGMRCGEPVMLVDVLPTILDYLGLPAPPGIQGQSLLPVLRGETSWTKEGEEDRMRISEHSGRTAVRFDGRWKIVFLEAGTGKVSERALYDMVADPGEEKNLDSTPEGRKRFEEIFARYEAWRNETSRDDVKFRGQDVGGAIDDDLAAELSALGYTGFEED